MRQATEANAASAKGETEGEEINRAPVTSRSIVLALPPTYSTPTKIDCLR